MLKQIKSYFSLLRLYQYVASCSSDDDDEKEPETFSIVGTWAMEEGDMDRLRIFCLFQPRRIQLTNAIES